MANSVLMLTAQISDAERQQLKRIAKAKGMTFSGYIAQIVRREISNPDNDIAFPYSDSIRNGTPAIGNR